MHSRYAIYLNQQLKTDGQYLPGRYGTKLIETDAYFLEASHFIHRNALEAKMVSDLYYLTLELLPSYIDLTQNNPHIVQNRTLSYFGEPVEDEYRKFVEKMER
ncbi:hypothetical protein [Bacillus infantis]|uniref:hypothetical protein n=1 Tax=Bacillus infantis TaxID=324767 RepID=UPI0020A090A9|nr:hypothetical protein [Bacillus infantis]MCP1160718.1 hypothetical protein [Bacillus infantis]